MEESAKRRERLKAMRVDADRAEVSGSQDSPATSGSLSNPLTDPSSNPSATLSSPAAPRFDFYTDPMSAFSGSKRSKESNQTPRDYFSPSFSGSSPMIRFSPPYSGTRMGDMTPAPAHQLQMNYSPDPRSYVTPLPMPRSSSWRSPAEMASPFSGSCRSPASIPGSWNRSGGMVNYGFPLSSSRGGAPSPGLGRGTSPSPRGGGRRFGNNPSPGSGWSSGKGRGNHSYASAVEKPELFYHKSMVEDPWRFLKPVIGSLAVNVNSVKSPNTLKSWLPKSITMKKAKVTEEVSDGVRFQSSIADCLALSFEDAINE